MLDEECIKCGARSDELFLAKMAACCSGHSHFEVRTTSQRNFITSDNNLPINCFRYSTKFIPGCPLTYKIDKTYKTDI